MQQLDLFPGISGTQITGIRPRNGIELLSLTAQLRQRGDGGVQPHQRVPGGRPHNTIRVQIENFLKCPYGGFGSAAEDAIHVGHFGNGRIILGNPVQFHLNYHNIGAERATPQWAAGIGGGNAPDGSVIDDFHVSVVAAQNLRGIVALLRQILTAPLA